jgi:hypothetical protein
MASSLESWIEKTKVLIAKCNDSYNQASAEKGGREAMYVYVHLFSLQEVLFVTRGTKENRQEDLWLVTKMSLL